MNLHALTLLYTLAYFSTVEKNLVRETVYYGIIIFHVAISQAIVVLHVFLSLNYI